MKSFTGLLASKGIAIAPLWLYHPPQLQWSSAQNGQTEEEQTRLKEALQTAETQIKALYQKALESSGEEEAAIFEAHEMLLSDPEFQDEINSLINTEHFQAEEAVHRTTEKFAKMFLELESEYFQARAADIRDIGKRLLYALQGIDPTGIEMPDEPVILLAEDLSPSDTMQFERHLLQGICTLKGGPTSHTAILARSLGIPAVVSLRGELENFISGTPAILDGESGRLICQPNQSERESWLKKQKDLLGVRENQNAGKFEKAQTLDGKTVEIAANIGGIEDAQTAVQSGAEGVGLLRSEFIYLERDSMPAENEQIKTYTQIAEILGQEKPIVVRLLDIGGDKELSYLDLEKEDNPFLGWRAVRMLSERADIFESQLRALLQGFLGSQLHIMLPLVSQIEEVRQMRELLEKVKTDLRAEGVSFQNEVKFGIMIEVPSAALLSPQLAKEVDFFSIGTNDLTQYTLAVDRTNPRVAALASYFHPAVLRLISMTINAAHAEGKWVGLCGEMAADPLAIPLLLGMGLDEFSMAPISIPEIKHVIRELDVEECKVLANDLLTLATANEVIEEINRRLG